MVSRAEEFTVGVEEELQVIDPLTRGLRSRAQQILSRVPPSPANEIRSELHLSMLETVTPVCSSLEGLRLEITRLRRELITAAEQEGCWIAAAGTHPFSAWQDQEITPTPRYREIEQRYQQLARESIIYGYHVHVGLSDRDAAVHVVNRARNWLPPMLALTANSPFWMGSDTGYASYRSQLWLNWPTSGPPCLFQSRAEYDALVRAMLATGSINDATNLYWDIRLPVHIPTVEFRIMDVCMTVDEAVMVAGLTRALVRVCYEQAVRQEPFPQVRPELLRAAHWRAARYGLTGELIDVETGRLVPATQLIEALLDFVQPALSEFGDWAAVSAMARDTLRRGTGASRQRATYKRTGRLDDVVDLVVSETAKGVMPL